MLGFIHATMMAIATLAQAVPAPPAYPVPSPQEQCRPDREPRPGTPRPPRIVDGARLDGPDALYALRRSAGNQPIIVTGGNFRRADLRHAPLRGICFIDTDFVGSDWRGADAAGLVFVRADLTGAQLAGARMPGVVFRDSILDGVDAGGAILTRGRIEGGSSLGLERLILDRADLSGFRFICGITFADGCALESTMSMRGANLARAELDTIWFTPDWAGARFDRTLVRPSQLVELGNVDLAGPLWLRAGEGRRVELSPADFAALRPHIRLPEAVAPSFDCARAASPVERAICAPEAADLRSLDRDLDALYRRAVAIDPRVAAGQRAWIRERDRCGDVCLEQSYQSRIDQLVARLGPPEWARPGGSALFVTPEILFEESFRADPLYRRLVPAIAASSFGRVLVLVNADGTIEAHGDAIGGNAHLCGLHGRQLRFDPATGWYSGPQEAHESDPAELRGRPMRVLRFAGDWADVFGRGRPGLQTGDSRDSDYASCGLNAAFDRLLRVPVTEAEVREMLENYRDIE